MPAAPIPTRQGPCPGARLPAARTPRRTILTATARATLTGWWLTNIPSSASASSRRSYCRNWIINWQFYDGHPF